MTDTRCDEVRSAFQRHEVPLGADLELHVKSCERCRELLAADGRLGHSLAGLPRVGSAALLELRAAVVESVRQEKGLRAWLRSRSRKQRLAYASLAALLLAALVLLRSRRTDFWSVEPLALW